MNKRKDGRWVVKRYIDGEAKYFYSTADNERKAEKDIERQMLMYQKKDKKPLFEEVAEEWESYACERVAPKTWLTYKTRAGYAIDAFRGTQIDKITPGAVQQYILRMSKDQYGNPRAHKTVKSILSVLSLIMDMAIISGYIEINPCENIKIPANLPQKKRQLPTEADLAMVRDGLHCHFGDFAFFLLYTGLRRGEALALMASDIDWKKRVIHVRRSLDYHQNTATIKTPKTANGIRDVYLLDVLDPILKGRKGYIFGDDKGGPRSEMSFRIAWERYTKESGVTLTPHQLRHAYATILYDAGINAKSAQSLLGHADYKTTMDIYTHISEERQKEDYSALNNFLNKKKTSQKR